MVVMDPTQCTWTAGCLPLTGVNPQVVVVVTDVPLVRHKPELREGDPIQWLGRDTDTQKRDPCRCQGD